MAANLGQLKLVKEPKKEGGRVGVDYPYILQVSPTTLRLLDGPHLLEHLSISTEWRVFLASVADPYVLVGTEDDDLVLITLRGGEADSASGADADQAMPATGTDGKRPGWDDDEVGGFPAAEALPDSKYLRLSRPKVAQVSAPISFCLYHDSTGRLARWLKFCPHRDGGLLWVPNQHSVDMGKNANVDADG